MKRFAWLVVLVLLGLTLSVAPMAHAARHNSNRAAQKSSKRAAKKNAKQVKKDRKSAQKATKAWRKTHPSPY